ncbi:hypothetical protein [Pseudoponticoccus marisrubri]|uniref:Sulfotransferase domain-containing protein n=1 Tax=Pseudoponticoccus marisrubri TaxID=1685382 RepID=A0A0W7WN71_9RHOB|nr:hypothetical protein [Pseudoponticoccus marisrubri]KUF12030.1 hypothetical protein AVJ23_05500 [Pseudoponticoccus marisrubri]
MDIILHLGAHRTGSTSFQAYLRAHRAVIDGQGAGFWGPRRTRTGLLHGLSGPPATAAQARRARGRVQLNLAAARRQGVGTLIVSDENLIGSTRGNLRARTLYPDIGERMARLHAAFAPVTRIVLQIRSPETWWASALSFLVARGEAVPPAQVLDRIAGSPRSWRHVIADLACACPGAELRITPFERFADHPHRLLRAMGETLQAPDCAPGAFWANRRPDLAALRACLAERGSPTEALPDGAGRWQPFDAGQSARLREAYADDLFWLRAGADGLAILTEDPEPERPAFRLAAALQERGHAYERSARRLAPNG